MTNQITVIDEVRSTIGKMSPQFAMVLPSHITPEKFQRVAMTAIQNNPDLLNADKRSLYAACMKAAQDGLLPDGREAAFVTFNTKNGKMIQFMPMVAGIMKKVRQSGELATIHAAVVYANDKFRYWVDTEGQHIEHEPILFGERGKPIGVYAMAKTKDGSVFVQPMSIADVDKIKASSRSKDGGPWSTWWDEMAKKSAIRRLAKYLPQSSDIEQTLRSDEDLFMPEPAQQTDAPMPVQDQEKPKRKSRLDKVKETVNSETVEVTDEQQTIEHQPQYEPGSDQDDVI